MNAIAKPAEGTAPDDGHSSRMPSPRLRLTPDTSHGPLDGAWWPHCDALEPGLPALVAFLDPGIGTVTRVTLGTASWPDAPHVVVPPAESAETAALVPTAASAPGNPLSTPASRHSPGGPSADKTQGSRKEEPDAGKQPEPGRPRVTGESGRPRARDGVMEPTDPLSYRPVPPRGADHGG
ncbi:DUF5994 family protein [Streptomyces sp. MB22_4]|uniref:DUF5994 family protein n=1 Tax=Streptomyces sp. MB22_4 TaxID=3383120 RepID=UPI0039A05B25